MYRNTRFGELLKGLPRSVFERHVAARDADKHSKGFRSWDQLMGMLFGQLSGSRSLRTLEVGFNSQQRHHYHIGSRAIKRTTLADANAKRDAGLFADVCQGLLAQAHRSVARQGRELLYLLDATPIPLKGRGFDDWARHNHSARTQGLKVHLLYAPQAQVPVYSHITPPNVNDVEDARRLAIESGATYVFDKGYCDYGWWHAIDRQHARFVTRFKRNAALQTLEQRAIPAVDQARILEDHVVGFNNRRPRGGKVNPYQAPLRRIVVARPGHKTPLVLATNDFDRSALEVADLYKARWQIELFFKWIKQHLKIKRFLGRSENAVRIQILTALIAYLLVALYRRRHGITTSLRLCLTMLSATLFQRVETDAHLLHKQRRRTQAIQAVQPELAL